MGPIVPRHRVFFDGENFPLPFGFRSKMPPRCVSCSSLIEFVLHWSGGRTFDFFLDIRCYPEGVPPHTVHLYAFLDLLSFSQRDKFLLSCVPPLFTMDLFHSGQPSMSHQGAPFWDISRSPSGSLFNHICRCFQPPANCKFFFSTIFSLPPLLSIDPHEEFKPLFVMSPGALFYSFFSPGLFALRTIETHTGRIEVTRSGTGPLGCQPDPLQGELSPLPTSSTSELPSFAATCVMTIRGSCGQRPF